MGANERRCILQLTITAAQGNQYTYAYIYMRFCTVADLAAVKNKYTENACEFRGHNGITPRSSNFSNVRPPVWRMGMGARDDTL